MSAANVENHSAAVMLNVVNLCAAQFLYPTFP